MSYAAALGTRARHDALCPGFPHYAFSYYGQSETYSGLGRTCFLLSPCRSKRDSADLPLHPAACLIFADNQLVLDLLLEFADMRDDRDQLIAVCHCCRIFPACMREAFSGTVSLAAAMRLHSCICVVSHCHIFSSSSCAAVWASDAACAHQLTNRSNTSAASARGSPCHTDPPRPRSHPAAPALPAVRSDQKYIPDPPADPGSSVSGRCADRTGGKISSCQLLVYQISTPPIHPAGSVACAMSMTLLFISPAVLFENGLNLAKSRTRDENRWFTSLLDAKPDSWVII